MTLAEIITPEELASLLSEEKSEHEKGVNMAMLWGGGTELRTFVNLAVQDGWPPGHVAGMLRTLAYIKQNLQRKAVPVEVIK